MPKFKIQKNKVQSVDANRVGLFVSFGVFFKVKIYTNDLWIQNFTWQIINSIWIQYIDRKQKHPTMQYSLKYNHML